MNLDPHIYQIRRWIQFAIVPALVVGLLGYLYTEHRPKLYTTSTILYVQHPVGAAGDPSTNGDIFGAEAIIPTYSAMITSPVIARAVDRDMARRYPGYSLEAHGVSVAAGSPGAAVTQLMTVSVSDTVPQRAAVAADSVARAFIDYIVRIQKARFSGNEQSLQRQIGQAESNIQYVTQRISDYRGPKSGMAGLKASLSAYETIYQSLLTSSQAYHVDRSTALQGVRVFSPAAVPTSPVAPHPVRSAIIAAFLALLACGGAIYLYDYLDDVLRTPEEMSGIANAPILGTIRQFNLPPGDSPLVTARQPRSPVADAYRLVRTNIQFAHAAQPPRTILITSPFAGEGKSTTAANLARVLAEGGQTVTLVDCDLRRPDLHRVFGLGEEQSGLTDLLGEDHLNGHAVKQADLPKLSIVASGTVAGNPADLLGSHRMQSALAQMRDRADIVLFDSPPALAVPDAAVLAAAVDGVILVVDPTSSRRRDVRRACQTIEAVGGRMLGVVINRLDPHGSLSGYYYDSRYGYGEIEPSRKPAFLRSRRTKGAGR